MMHTKVLILMFHSDNRLLDYCGRAGQCAEQWNLTNESSFIDIGSGYGKVVFHAALAVGVTRAQGVEYVQSRHDIAVSVA